VLPGGEPLYACHVCAQRREKIAPRAHSMSAVAPTLLAPSRPRVVASRRRCIASAAAGPATFLHSHEVRTRARLRACLPVAMAGTQQARMLARARVARSRVFCRLSRLSAGKQGPDGSTTFSFDTGDGKPPKPKASASASAGKAASAQAAHAGGASMAELEKQMAAAWKAAGAR